MQAHLAKDGSLPCQLTYLLYKFIMSLMPCLCRVSGIVIEMFSQEQQAQMSRRLIKNF